MLLRLLKWLIFGTKSPLRSAKKMGSFWNPKKDHVFEASKMAHFWIQVTIMFCEKMGSFWNATESDGHFLVIFKRALF